MPQEMLAVEGTHLDNIRYGPQVGYIFLGEEGDCNAPLTRPARPSDTVYVCNSRLREREDGGSVRCWGRGVGTQC